MSHNRPVLRLFFINWALGIFLGCVFATGTLYFDLGGLGSLVVRSELGYIAAIMLFVGFSVTWGAVVCASAIMRLTHDDDAAPTGLAEAAEPLPVRVGAMRR